jgi:hypothetical protein
VRGGRALAQDGVGLFRDIFDLHAGHGAIMALEAPVHNRVAVGGAGRRSAMDRPAARRSPGWAKPATRWNATAPMATGGE